jgi:hypothetical protein
MELSCLLFRTNWSSSKLYGRFLEKIFAG